jgi:rod shape determining protein RodA
MSKSFKEFFSQIDWILLLPAVIISLAGIVTMNSFTGVSKFFDRQLIWLGVSLCVFFFSSRLDWRFLKRTRVIMILYSVSIFLLTLLFVVGSVFKGAKSWFDLGLLAFQPVDFSKLIVILILSKYFSRRHIEIADVRHIIVSGFYVFTIFFLVFLQPDFGSSVIIFFVWLGMVLVSGISKKHLLLVGLCVTISFAVLWFFIFKPYQKARIINFIHPLTDVRGTGYNAYQSTIAVGSGQLLGKGIGYGTQSKLQFLPEYQTDFIFAAFAEEWGFVGVMLLLILFGIIFSRMLIIASHGGSNFEVLFGMGLSILFVTHATINIGTNIGVLPVTGVTLPFMSYGGSHLINEFLGLGILVGMSRYGRAVHKESAGNEIVGIS